MNFQKVLNKYREISFSERDKGDRFERLIKFYLQTDPTYSNLFNYVWLWDEFPSKMEFGGKDVGIDIVARTYDNAIKYLQKHLRKRNIKTGYCIDNIYYV